MAIENAAIAKIAGSLIAVGGASGGIYAYHDTLKNIFFDTNIRSYLVKKDDAVTATQAASAASTSNLYKTDDKSKLFSCKLGEEIDKSCELFELKEKDKGYVNLSDLNTTPPTQPSTFTEAKYYKLTIDVSKFSKWDETKLPTIKIIDSATGKSEIVTLKLLLRTDKLKEDTKTNVVIAKLDETLSTEISATDLSASKCHIGKSSFACDIYKITSGDKTVDKVKFPQLSKLSSTFSTSDGTKDFFFLLTFDKNIDLSSLTNKNSDKKILLKHNDATKATFIFNSFVFNTLESDVTKSNAVLFQKLTPAS